MKFTLTIELGNDAAQTYGDIQFMLRRMAGALTHVAKHAPLATDGGGKIADINGNSVGEWKIEADLQKALKDAQAKVWYPDDPGPVNLYCTRVGNHAGQPCNGLPTDSCKAEDPRKDIRE